MRARNFALTHFICDTDNVTTRKTGLRERKKQATKEALRTAALRLAHEHGPENVRVDDIAEAAGVSPRTYNNYFSSREQAIIAAITADRESRIAADILEQPTDASLADAVFNAVIAQYTAPDEQARDNLLLITTSPGLRAAYIETASTMEQTLTTAITDRVTHIDRLAARVLATSVAAAVRVALDGWLDTSRSVSGLVVPSGSLPDLLRAALTPLAPAFDAAER